MKERKTMQKGVNKKLLYSVVLVTIILLGVLVTYYLFLPHTEKWTAGIIDQLAVGATLTNQSKAFNTTSTSILNASGFDVKYYPSKDVTVDFYKDLPSKGSEILLLRVHSAIRENTTNVDLFTSEVFQESLAYGKYFELVSNGYISKAVFDVPPYNEYFAIGPTFVSSVMKGKFADSLIILMGCDSLNQATMAEALVERGAKVVIGWTKKVDLIDTDNSTIQLLEHLLSENPYTVDGAVEKINENPHPLGATLDYYPKNAGSYIVPRQKRGAPFALTEERLTVLLLTTLTEWKRDKVQFSN